MISPNKLTNNYNTNELVRQIHQHNKANNTRFVIAITGGGISALSMLFSQPGASASILECTVPYACEATLDYTGAKEIKSWSSTSTANLIASSALDRCEQLIAVSKQGFIPVAIGATGNLVSGENLKRGLQGIYVSSKSYGKSLEFQLNLYKGEKGLDGEKDKHFRTRQEEDELCGQFIVCACALHLGLLDVNTLIDWMESNGLDLKDSLYVNNMTAN